MFTVLQVAFLWEMLPYAKFLMMGNMAYGMIAGTFHERYALIEHLLCKVSLTGLESLLIKLKATPNRRWHL